jgi:hypothetical protein
MGKFLRCGRSIRKIYWWKNISGSRYCTYRNISRRLGKVGSEGEEHNMIMLLDSVLLNVSGEATAKDLWNKLGVLYQYKSLVNNFSL